MILTLRERRALSAARDPDGVDRAELAKYGVGEKTMSGLIERGLLEQFPHPVVPEETLYRVTAAGRASRAAPPLPKPQRTGSKLKMLESAFKVMDPRNLKY